jgi:hypothetical protein
MFIKTYSFRQAGQSRPVETVNILLKITNRRIYVVVSAGDLPRRRKTTPETILKKSSAYPGILSTNHRRTPRLSSARVHSWHTLPCISHPGYFFSSSAPFSSFSPSFFSFLFPLTFFATTAFPKSPIVSPVIVPSPVQGDKENLETITVPSYRFSDLYFRMTPAGSECEPGWICDFCFVFGN